MDDKKRNEYPDYGVRLTGDELAEHQQRHQQARGPSGDEYGPQGQQSAQLSSEYGPQQGGLQQAGVQYSGQPLAGPQLTLEMTRPPKRPRILEISFWAIVVAGISYLIAQLIVASLPNRGMSDQDIEMLDSMMGSIGDQVPFDSMEAYLNSSMMTAAMIGQAIILAVAYLLVGLGIRNGWRSMRVLGTIFAVLSLLNLSFVTPLVGVLTTLAVALGIVGIIYAWLPASTEYYRQKAWQKAAKKIYPDAPSR